MEGGKATPAPITFAEQIRENEKKFADLRLRARRIPAAHTRYGAFPQKSSARFGTGVAFSKARGKDGGGRRTPPAWARQSILADR